MATSSPTREYDGTGDYLDTNDTSTYDFVSGTKTYIAWTFADTNSSRRPITGNMETNSPFSGWGWYLSDTSGGEMDLLQDGSTASTSSIVPETAAWNGLGVEWRISGPSADFYQVDSNKDFNLDLGVSSSGNPSVSTNSLRIGDAGLDEFFDGALNHVQIFNVIVGDNSINNAIWAPGSVTKGLLGYWPAYGQLDPEPDLSVTGADASVVGSGGTRTEACPAIPQQMPIT